MSRNILSIDIDHPTDRPNFTALYLPGALTLWFSYSTLIAFHTPETGRVLSANHWGVTTGKHLNYLGDKDDRIPRAEFEALAERVLMSHCLVPEGGSGLEPMIGGQ